MNSLSMSPLGSAGRRGDLANPIPLRLVVDLGTGAEFFQKPEAAALRRVFKIVQIAEPNGAGRARFHTRRHIVRGIEIAPALRRRARFRRMPAAVTKVALLDYTAHPRRYRGIERLFHTRRPRRIPPVEVPRMIRAGGHAVAAAEATFRHLADNPGSRIQLHRLLRANAHAGGILSALLAQHREKCPLAINSFCAVVETKHADPGDPFALVYSLRRWRNVVLDCASHHAGAAAGTFVDVDRHAITPGAHIRTLRLDSWYNLLTSGGIGPRAARFSQFSATTAGVEARKTGGSSLPPGSSIQHAPSFSAFQN